MQARYTFLKNIAKKLYYESSSADINEFINTMLIFFAFSHPCNDRKSIVFGSNFQNGDFNGFTRY